MNNKTWMHPIYMTHPTKAICPILLEDYRRIQVDRMGDTNFFTSQMIKDCMKKVVALNLNETHRVDDELEIKPYYAGHVLGAAMIHLRVGSQSIVYTGDYNMTPDRHLGAAWIDRCRPDLLITESTYATTIRDSKRCREADFLKKVHGCVENGGKVLIPVFALGRAQELCILLETYWERTGLKVPVYFTAGLMEKANRYYKLFISWTNEKLKRTFVRRNMFEFHSIRSFEKSFMDNPGPMVLFSAPGMLHAGQSLAVFQRWAPDERNMVIMPGYCVAGTVGHKVLSGKKEIEINKKTVISVRLSVQHLSFSAHADAKGIMQLIQMCQPGNVMLVHGERDKMNYLKEKIETEYGCPCTNPANGSTVSIDLPARVPIDVSVRLLKNTYRRNAKLYNDSDNNANASTVVSAGDDYYGCDENEERQKRIGDVRLDTPTVIPMDKQLLEGVLVTEGSRKPLRLLEASEAAELLGLSEHRLSYETSVPLDISKESASNQSILIEIMDEVQLLLAKWLFGSTPRRETLETGDIAVSLRSVLVTMRDTSLNIHWSHADDELGGRVTGLLRGSHSAAIGALEANDLLDNAEQLSC